MTEEHITFAAVLTFVGGLVTLIVGAIVIDAGLNAVNVTGTIALPSPAPGTLIALGIAGVVLGLFIIVLSLVLVGRPDYNVGLGAVIILLALVSLVGIGIGDGVGFLLTVLGGAVAMAFGPEDRYELARRRRAFGPTSSPIATGVGGALLEPPAGGQEAPTPLQPPQTYRGCTACGKASVSSYAFCPHCGAGF